MERVRSPAGRVALRRAIRVAAVASVGFLLARFAFGNAQMAVFAAFSAIAMATIPDLRGSRGAWIAVHAVATLAAAPLVALGTAVSGDTLLASVTMFAVVLGTLLVCAGGGYLATLGNVLVMVYVVGASVPAPAGTIGWRLLGLATTGVLAIVAILVLGPEPAEPRLRLAIAGVYRTLAELAGAVLDSASAHRVAGCCASVHDAVDAVYPAVGSIADHPPGSDRVERTEMHLLGRAFRIEAALTTLARVGRADPPVGPDLLPAVRDALAACGDALAAGTGPPDVRPVHRAWTAAREGAASGSPPATVSEAAAVRELLTAGQLTTGAAAEACVTLGATRAPGVAAALRDATEPATPGRRAAPVEWADRVRVQLTPRSQYLRNSFRLALGLSVARALAGVLGLSHGFWVVFATLTVMRTTASRTGGNLVQALAGTVAGAAVASALVLLVGKEHLIYVFLVPVLFFLCMYLAAVWSLLVAQAAFTVTVVVLFNLITPAGWALALTRVEDVAVGAAAGIAIGVLVWPRGAASQVRRSFGDLLVGAGQLVREGAAGLDPGGPAESSDSVWWDGGGSGTAAAARRLLRTIHACDDVLARRLAERDDHVGFDAWVRLLALSRMVWWAGQEVTEQALRDVPAECERLRIAARELAVDTAGRLEDLGAALRARAPAPSDPHGDPGPLEEAAQACDDGGVGGARTRQALLLAVLERNLARDGAAAAEAVDRLAGPPVRPGAH